MHDAKDDWEIYGRIKVDAGNAASARFLSVLQWGPANFSADGGSRWSCPVPGRKYEGALVGSSLVMFMRDRSANFTTMIYPASGATMQLHRGPGAEHVIHDFGVRRSRARHCGQCRCAGVSRRWPRVDKHHAIHLGTDSLKSNASGFDEMLLSRTVFCFGRG